MTETRIPKNVSVIQNIILNNYSFEHIPTESSAESIYLQHLLLVSYADIQRWM